MKAVKIVYWIATSLVGLGLLMGGSQMLMQSEQMIASVQKLGYPLLILPILGLAKVLSAVALLVPKFPKLKEWAYAGTVFLYIGAIWSHIAANDAAGSAPAFISLLFLVASYIMYQRIRSRQPQAMALNAQV